MVGVPVFSDWRQFSATLIHVHATTHCVTFCEPRAPRPRTMYLGRSLSRSSSSSANEHDFSRGERARPRRLLRSPRVTCQPTKTTSSANWKLKRRVSLKPRLLLLLLLLLRRRLFFFSAKSRGFRSESDRRSPH